MPYNYNPRDYVPDFSWVGQSFNTIANAVAQSGPAIREHRLNKESVKQAYDQAVESFENLASERLTDALGFPLLPEEAKDWAKRNVPKYTKSDFEDPQLYLERLKNNAFNWDRYAQAKASFDSYRRESPEDVSMPPPKPNQRIKPEEYQNLQQEWYDKWNDKRFANYLRQTGAGPQQGQQLSVDQGQVGTGQEVALPQPTEAQPPAAGAPPSPPGPAGTSSFAVPTQQTTTPSPTGRPAAAAAPGFGQQQQNPALAGFPGLQVNPAEVMAQGIETGRAPEANELIKQYQDLARLQSNFISKTQQSARAQQTQLAQTFGTGFPEGTEVSTQDIISGNLSVPLGERYERPAPAYGGYGGIPPQVRYNQEITKLINTIGTAIDEMGNFARRGADRSQQMAVVAQSSRQIAELMRLAGRSDEEIRLQLDSFEAAMRAADPQSAEKIFGPTEKPSVTVPGQSEEPRQRGFKR